MRLLIGFTLCAFSLVQCVYSHASTAQPKRSVEVRKAQAIVSKSLYAKLKSQALNEARAEVLAESEARERAKLEALQELEAGVSNATDNDNPDNK